jgi:hypothetical protein
MGSVLMSIWNTDGPEVRWDSPFGFRQDRRAPIKLPWSEFDRHKRLIEKEPRRRKPARLLFWNGTQGSPSSGYPFILRNHLEVPSLSL